MNELRFDRILTVVLLAFSTWYAVTMFLYPANAGRVPGIVALVAIGALIVQLALSFRPSKPTTATAESPVLATPGSGEGATATGSLPIVQEVEPDTYDNLLALRGPRLRRFLVISGFILAYYVGALLVGWVISTTVLLPAVLLLSGERVRVVVIAGVASAIGSYLLVVQLLGLPLLDGFFFGG